MKACLECIHCCDLGYKNYGIVSYKCLKKPVSNLPSFPFKNTKCDEFFAIDDIKLHKRQTVLGIFAAVAENLINALYKSTVNENKLIPDTANSKATMNAFQEVFSGMDDYVNHYIKLFYEKYFDEFRKYGSKSQGRCFEKISRIVNKIIIKYSTNEAVLDKIARDFKLDKFYDTNEQECIDYKGNNLVLQGEANVIGENSKQALFYYGDDGEVYVKIQEKKLDK